MRDWRPTAALRAGDLVLPDEACIDDDGVREPLLPDDASVASEPHTRVTPVFAPAESFGPAGLTLPVKTPAPTAAATNGSATQGSGSLAARGAMGLGLVEDEDGESVLVDVGDGAPIADAQGSAKVRAAPSALLGAYRSAREWPLGQGKLRLGNLD